MFYLFLQQCLITVKSFNDLAQATSEYGYIRASVTVKLTNSLFPLSLSIYHPSHESVVDEVLLDVTETVGLLGTGALDVHLDFHTAPGL